MSTTPGRESWIRRVLGAFVEWLNGPQRTGYDPTMGAPVQPDRIDVAAVARNMKLVKKGVRDGQQETPPTESQGLGEVEMEISNFIERERAKWQAYIQYWANKWSRDLGELTGRLLTGNYAALARIASTGGINALRTRQQIAEDELNELQNNVDDEYERCERLRQLMNIKGAPKNIPSVALHLVLLAVIWCAEALLNGTFLGLRSVGGLIEGLSTAAGIAFINVALGFFAGYWTWVYLRHWLLWVKGLNIVVLMILVLFTGAINLAVGHYRDILDEGLRTEGGWMTATREAFERFMADAWGIQDLMSWALVGIGCLCAMLAAIGAHLMRDPYPQYGAAHKALSRAQAELNVKRTGHLQELQRILDSTLNELTALARAAANPMIVYQEINGIEEDLKRLGAEDEESRQRLQRAGEDLLSTYRNENKVHRKTAPPQHWKVSFQLGEGAPPFTPPALVKPPNLATDTELLIIDDHVASVDTTYRKALKALRPCENTAPESGGEHEQDE